MRARVELGHEPLRVRRIKNLSHVQTRDVRRSHRQVRANMSIEIRPTEAGRPATRLEL